VQLLRRAPRRLAGWLACAAILVSAVSPASAQVWPRGTVSAFDGRLTIGGDLSATYGGDDPGYFNDTDYGSNTLRRSRASLLVEVAPNRRVAWLGEARIGTDHGLDIYAAYMRLTPWPDRALALQAGRIPPVFGSWSRRGYAAENPLIGEPVLYQYLTSLRADALPRTSADLLRMRGRGWRTTYPVGNAVPASGLPVIAGPSWDTGIQLHLGTRPLEAAVAWTTGSLSKPGVAARPGGGGWSARMAATPSPGMTVGVSGARGTFVLDSAVAALPPASRTGGTQSALGIDAEWAHGHWLYRGELVRTSWSLPAEAGGPLPLTSLGGYVETRYRLHPRVFVAGRLERLSFGTITSPSGPAAWDARVTRVEAGAGVSLAPRLRVKLAWQLDTRDGGRVRRDALVAAQVLSWF
jgi:hypothetical protein